MSRDSYPQKVKERYAKLREELPYHITIRTINNIHYIVRQEFAVPDEKGKKKLFQEYIGKITDEGIFRPKLGESASEFEVAEAIINAKGGKVIMPQENENRTYSIEATQFTEKEEDVLTNLTMNARMPYDMLAKNTALPAKKLPDIVKGLEKRMKLSYAPYIRLDKLGFMEFFIFVKFLDKKPDPEAAKVDLEKIGSIQLAAFTTGKYDMIMFVIAESNENLAEVVRNIKKSSSLASLPSKWEVSFFYISKGFAPLRMEFFDVLAKRIWHRTKEVPRLLPTQVLKTEFGVLKSINEDGSTNFAEIERQNGLSKGSARHIYDRLIKKEILPRVTINIGSIGLKYDAIILMQIIEEKAFQDSRKDLLKFIMEEEAGYVTNRFSLVGDISNPEGGLFFLPVIKGDELEKTVSELQKRVKGIKTSTLVIDSIMFGRILHRRIDPLTTSQHYYLVTNYKEKLPQSRVYDEETFDRIERIQSKYERFENEESE